MKNNWMKKGILVILFVVAFFIIFGHGKKVAYDRTFDSELYAQHDKLWVQNGEAEAGLFSAGPSVNLQKGSYLFHLTYLSSSEKNMVSIYTMEGEPVEYVRQQLPATSGMEKLSFLVSFPDTAYDVQLITEYCGEGNFAIESLQIQSEGWTGSDAVAITVMLCLLVGIYLFLFRKDKNRKELLCPSNIYLFLTGTAIAISVPLMTDYLLQGNDLCYHLNRIEGIRAGLLDGQFPVRIHANVMYGYGYGSSFFYPELLLYFPAILRICGVSMLVANKIYLVFINMLTGWLMYIAAARILKSREAGCFAAFFYMTAIFRLAEGYIDYAYGQFTSMAFLPLLLLGVYELLAGDENKWGYAVAGFSLVLESHVLTTVWSVIFIAVSCLLSARRILKKERLLACLKAVSLTILLNLWFVVPFLYMMREPINFSTLYYPFDKLAIPVALLLKAFPEIGNVTTQDGAKLANVLPLTIGMTLIISNLVLLISRIPGYRKKEENLIMRKKAWVLFTWGIVMLFFSSRLMPWNLFFGVDIMARLLKFTQFPFRFLAFASCFLSLSGAAGIVIISKEYPVKQVAYAGILLVSVITTAAFLDSRNDAAIAYNRMEVVASDAIAGGEYLYQGTTEYLELRQLSGRLCVEDKTVRTWDFEKNGTAISFSYENPGDKDFYVELPLLYYPGYVVMVNGEKADMERGNQNVIRLWLKAGTEGRITVSYQGLISWRISEWISGMTFCIFVMYCFSRKGFISKKHNKKNSKLEERKTPGVI